MTSDQIINWLLEGDVSVQYQVYRDLLKLNRNDLQSRIEKEGWGNSLLKCRHTEGHWGLGFYQPKWTSTHYTLLDLRNLCISPEQKKIRESIHRIIHSHKASDGGINPGKTIMKSDVCINGMFLNYACYFGSEPDDLKSIVDFLLAQQMSDGGFNCRSNRSGAVHSSLHTSLSVLEGIQEYLRNNYTYRLPELKIAQSETIEFILKHKLYQSHRTGETIDQKMLNLSYPSRWRYDILRALDSFQFSGVPFDVRMTDALEILVHKRRKDKLWPLQARHPGKVHLEMEETGKPSRWNTLRALRVLRHFQAFFI